MGAIILAQQTCLSVGNHPSWAVQQHHNKSPSRLRPDPYKNGPWLSGHFQSSSPYLSKVKHSKTKISCTSRIEDLTHEQMIQKKRAGNFNRHRGVPKNAPRPTGVAGSSASRRRLLWGCKVVLWVQGRPPFHYLHEVVLRTAKKPAQGPAMTGWWF